MYFWITNEVGLFFIRLLHRHNTCFSTKTRPFPIPRPLVASSQLWAKNFPYVHPSTQILCITSALYAYEDGTDIKFGNVGTKSSDAGRLPKGHNTAVPINFSSYFYISLCKDEALLMRGFGCRRLRKIAGYTRTCSLIARGAFKF